MGGLSLNGVVPSFQIGNGLIHEMCIGNTQIYPCEGAACQLRMSTTTGSLSQNTISVLYGSTYTIANNVLTINDHGTTHTITFTPYVTDEYHTYGTTSTWGNFSASGTITKHYTFTVDVSVADKYYNVILSYGKNTPWLDDSEYHGWDNGDSSGNITLSLNANTVYTIHKEDSAGTSVSYIADGINRLATFTVNTDLYYVGVYGFYFGNVVQDSDPATIYLDTYQSPTHNSESMTFKPGDYIRDNGGSEIKLNAHLKQSWCWSTRYSGSWVKAGTVEKTVTQNYSATVEGIVAGSSTQYPLVIYLGLGSDVSTTAWNYVNGASGKTWVESDDANLTWRYISSNTNEFTVECYPGTRTMLMRWWYRWIFQRNY